MRLEDFSIKRYSNEDFEEWNNLVFLSKNSCLLHLRSFINYHANSFEDHSCLIFKRGKLLFLFPATQHGDQIRSHGGLTFGGIIMPFSTKSRDVITGLELICSYYKKLNFKSIIYKPTPYIYHKVPSEEDIFAINEMGAELFRYDISHVIERNNSRVFSNLRKRKIKNALKKGVSYMKYNEEKLSKSLLSKFYFILSQTLQNKNLKPVHTENEIRYLMENHPKYISLYLAKKEENVLAGSLIFTFGSTSHTQYLTSSKEGKEVGALDLIISKIIEKEPSNIKFISLGRSPQDKNTTALNEGLVFQKEGFGASAVMFNQYKINL